MLNILESSQLSGLAAITAAADIFQSLPLSLTLSPSKQLNSPYSSPNAKLSSKSPKLPGAVLDSEQGGKFAFSSPEVPNPFISLF